MLLHGAKTQYLPKKKAAKWLNLAAIKLASGGLGSIERSLKSHVKKGFFNFQRKFVPPFVPPFCLFCLKNLPLIYLTLFYLELDLPKYGLHNPRQIASWCGNVHMLKLAMNS